MLDKYEEENKLKIVSENYQKIISEYNGEKLILSALDSKKNIHTEIVKKVESI